MSSNSTDPPVVDIQSLQSRHFKSHQFEYSEKDVSLYALSLGATVPADLNLVYEAHPKFATLPTFAIIAAHPAIYAIPLDQYIPEFNPAAALHGEQYVQLFGPLPTSAKLVTQPQLISLSSKPGGAVAVIRTTSKDENTGSLVALNEFTVFVKGAGPFTHTDTHSEPTRPLESTAQNTPPACPPHTTRHVHTSSTQAALYRLNGDINPLHIDDEVAQGVGFPRPILHGLCTLGMSVREVVRVWGADDPLAVKSVKARFSKHVFPGDTLSIQMWQVTPTKVVFNVLVTERNAVVIANAAVEFHDGKLYLEPQSKL